MCNFRYVVAFMCCIRRCRLPLALPAPRRIGCSISLVVYRCGGCRGLVVVVKHDELPPGYVSLSTRMKFLAMPCLGVLQGGEPLSDYQRSSRVAAISALYASRPSGTILLPAS